MSGIFEQQVARIDALENAVRQLIQMAQAAPVTKPADPFGGLGGTTASPPPPPPVEVTPAMLQAVVEPLIANETAKGELVAHLQAMGIEGLPQARPDQYPELYRRFNEVKAKYAGATAAASTPSII